MMKTVTNMQSVEKRVGNTSRGFTLIETLVAISVLLLSLAGPLSIAVQSLNSAYYARDQITAFYLAQEGVEYVRAVRDENYLRGRSWLTGVTNCVDASCSVNFPDFNHSVCSGSCSPVLLNESTGLFGDNTGVETVYTRTLTLESIPGYTDEKVLSVTISWQTGGLMREFKIEEQFFDWLGI